MALESMTNVADDEKAGSESGDGRNLGNLENKENSSTAGSSAVSDAISAAAATSNSAQTRFSFYDAAEVQLQISGSSSSHQQDNNDLKKANRFNFYNAAELEEQQKQLKMEEERKRQQVNLVLVNE